MTTLTFTGWLNGSWGASFGTSSDAASGIRRLQIWELQEQELLKHAAKEAADKALAMTASALAEEKATPHIERTRSAARKKKTAPKPARKRVDHEEPRSAPVLAPIKTLPPISLAEMLSKLPPIVLEQTYWLRTQNRVIIHLDQERHRRRRRKLKVAAFILMAA